MAIGRSSNESFVSPFLVHASRKGATLSFLGGCSKSETFGRTLPSFTKKFEHSKHSFSATPLRFRAADRQFVIYNVAETVSAGSDVRERVKKSLLITAIKTPFLPTGAIDFATFDQLVEQQISSGVNGLVVGGTTGEGHLMSETELLGLIEHAASKFGDKLVIVGNTGGNNTSKALSNTRKGFAKGMHAALQINPYYGKTSQAGLLQHLSRLLEEGPAIIYNVPGRTGQDIKPEVILSLKSNPNLLGVKECAGNNRIGLYKDEGVMCWSGNDDECFAGRHASGSGVISVASNIIPNLMRRLMDDKSATALNQDLQPLISWLFCEPNPIAIDTALAMTGVVRPVFRLPYVPLSLEKREEGLSLLNKLSPSDVVGSKREVLRDEDFLLLDSF